MALQPVAPSSVNHYNKPNVYGEYQFISLPSIVTNFTAAYVGEGKILGNVNIGDVNFHAHRALQELSYDTFKSCKSQEVEVCGNLKMPLPHDYVNYVKITSVDSSGIEHIIYPTSKTSNPFAIEQDQDKCTDCNDTSASYQYGLDQKKKIAGGGVDDLAGLKPQEHTCDTVDVGCVFTPPVATENNVKSSPAGAIAVYSHMLHLDNVKFPGQGMGERFFDSWITSVDNYCNCLTDSEAENTCGNFIGWNMTFTSSPVFDLRNGAGWSGLRSTDPTINIQTALNGNWLEIVTSQAIKTETSDTWANYKSATPSENETSYNDGTYSLKRGERYGLDPQYSQTNGSFFIDCLRGVIHFSSNLSGKTIILKYISDSHGADDEMVVHKFAEEAMYKWIAYGCLSARIDVPEYILARFKREKFAETRKAKIRLSNIKLEEISQTFRGKSKQIKH